MTFKLYDRQNEYWTLIRREDVSNTRLAIFVHGFRGAHLSTWGQLPDYLLTNASNEEALAGWDYLFIGYETYSIKNYLAIAEIIATQWERASAGKPPYDPNVYNELALFGHSLGTLGIRQLLCASAIHPPGMLQALRAVVLLGSPVNGSEWARFGWLMKVPDVIAGKLAALRPSSYAIADSLEPDGAPLTMLHAWNRSVRQQLNGIKVTLWLGTDDQVVGDGGLVSWDGDDKHKCNLDHTNICKLFMTEGQSVNGHLLDILREQLR